LAKELGCEPEDETRALYAQIRDGALTQPQPFPVILSALPLAAVAQPTPRFVAREEELARLGTLLERALAGRGGVALISGEAGSGKTALLDEFARRAGQAHGDLIALRGQCNAHGGAGDPYLPFREMLQMLAGDVEGKRAGGTLSPEQARRAWEALPAVGAALVEHGPDLIDTFVPGEALLRRAEGFLASPAAMRWQPKLREMVRRAAEGAAPAPGTNLGAPAVQADLFAQVTQVLHTVSMSRPLLLIIDDLQWADGGTAALLFHLGRRLAGSRILLACACRPEALDGREGSQAAASGVGTVLQELCREWGDVRVDLERADGRAFVEAYVDGEPNRLGAAFRQALYDHTGGNPLFTVELLRSFERDGSLVQDETGRWMEAAGPDWGRWPPQVEAVIAAHMAGLPDDDRALLQAASVQGEHFTAEVAARVLGWGEEAVVRRLSGPLRTRHRLVQAVSLERLASSGQHPSAGSGQRLSRYRFHHALFHRSAYRSLDAVERARLHEATGRALEALYALPAGQPVGAQPQALAPELARHYEAAGMPLEAARYRLEAGRWATRLAACEEALAHLERGLALLESVAASGERLRLELGLRMAMVNPALLQEGWQAPTFRRALERLSDLTQRPDLQDDSQRLAALGMLAQTTIWSADMEHARRIGEQLLGLAQGGDQQSLRLAHWALGHSAWTQGRLVAAREHLAQALALHDPDAGLPASPVMGADPSVMGHATLGLVQWLLGYADQGRDGSSRAVAQSETLEQPPSIAFAHLMAGMMHMLCGRDRAAARSHAAAMEGLGQAREFYGGFVDALAGQAQSAKTDSAVPAMGSGLGMAGLMLIQASMLARAGQVEMALQAIDRALSWVEHTGVRVLEAEAWRTRGELLLKADEGRWTKDEGRKTTDDQDPGSSSFVGRPSSSGEAEACFRRALEVAREQGARWLELRAAVSLARLWQVQGQRDEARDLLAGIYGWFTEGFDTVDLVEAKALLEELE
jgi:tetratricopeptide (TPR) repeat protein